VKLKVLKRIWKQILEGLKYLHSQRPVIIHRDIKCENILYDVYDGEDRGPGAGKAAATGVPARIGRVSKCVASLISADIDVFPFVHCGALCFPVDDAMWKCVGTPAFMAPEMYCDYYDETVDVYAFGMCVLEMVTQRLPYEECQNACQVYRAVNSVRSLCVVLCVSVCACHGGVRARCVSVARAPCQSPWRM
jgi:WNK lysine deficient protein kinase